MITTQLLTACHEEITLGDAIQAFVVANAASPAVAFLTTEREYRVCDSADVSFADLAEAFEAECFTTTAVLRWVATGTSRPFTGTATVITENRGALPQGWVATNIDCEAAEACYALWGDVFEVGRDVVQVGDDARQFAIATAICPPTTSGDRLSLDVVEYAVADRWGNCAVIDERPVRLRVDRKEKR